MPPVPKHSKIITPDVGTPGRVFFQAVSDWADNEARRLNSGHKFAFDLRGSHLILKEDMIMLQRSVYHIADTKEIRFQEGPNSYSNLLAKLRRSRPQIDSGVEQRFVSFVKNEDIMSQLDQMDWGGVRAPRRKRASTAAMLGESSQSSQPREFSSLRQEVTAQLNEIPSQPVSSISLQAQNDTLCRNLLRSNVERRLADTGSQPSGLRYDMVVRNGSRSETVVSDKNKVRLSFQLVIFYA
jgi:hypothetical protein